MFLKVQSTTEQNVTIVSFEGQITVPEERGVLRNAIREALAANAASILLDLSRVSYIDSAGLGELIEAWVACSDKGVAIKLLHLQSRVAGMMQITRLLSVFECFDDRGEALRSFESAQAVGQG